MSETVNRPQAPLPPAGEPDEVIVQEDLGVDHSEAPTDSEEAPGGLEVPTGD